MCNMESFILNLHFNLLFVPDYWSHTTYKCSCLLHPLIMTKEIKINSVTETKTKQFKCIFCVVYFRLVSSAQANWSLSKVEWDRTWCRRLPSVPCSYTGCASQHWNLLQQCLALLLRLKRKHGILIILVTNNDTANCFNGLIRIKTRLRNNYTMEHDLPWVTLLPHEWQATSEVRKALPTY